jgi:hypothetical protein
MTFRDRGAIRLPFLRYNWSRNGWRFSVNSHTWHIKIPLLGSFSTNIRHKDDAEQPHWDHPGPGWWVGKRRKRT